MPAQSSKALQPGYPSAPAEDFGQLSAVIRRRAPLILICAVATAAVAFGVSQLQTNQYSATAGLLFQDPGFTDNPFGNGQSSPVVVDPAREAATNAKLVGLDVVAARAAKDLNNLSAEEIQDMVTVEPQDGSNLVLVEVTDTYPSRAAHVANTFAQEFIDFRAQADRSRLVRAERLAEQAFHDLTPEQQDGVRGKALSRGAEQLRILASLQTGNVELVQPATPPDQPSAPKPIRNAALGGILGLLLGLGLAFLLERLDRRLRNEDEIRYITRLPQLGSVPESKAISAANQGSAAPNLPFVEDESFRTLGASLRYFNVDRSLHSVLVTSQEAEVGKSTVAWNVARAAAGSSRVVVVEADLRNPTLAKQHGLLVSPGLTEILTHQVGLEDGVQSARPPASSGTHLADDGSALDVIVAGSMPPNPAELIGSESMNFLLSDLAEHYDLVVIDSPPIGVVSDAFPLLRSVGGVVVVFRLGTSTRDGAQRLREQLDHLGAPVLGFVANGVKPQRWTGYGNHGYGTYRKGVAAAEVMKPSGSLRNGGPSED